MPDQHMVGHLKIAWILAVTIALYDFYYQFKFYL